MIDLHTHSTASDGNLSPSQLITEAHTIGLSAIALTDHDTINGIDEARSKAEELGIRFIPGIEIAIDWEPGEFHLLGLGLQLPNTVLSESIAGLAYTREKRNREILIRMNEQLGFHVDYEDVVKLGHSIGRPHFARLLIQHRIVKNIEQAFDRYLGKGRPFYVPKKNLVFQDAVNLIKAAGGIAVLAHPMSLYVAWGRLPLLIASLKEQGLDGIEAWHPTIKSGDCKRLEDLGRKLGLFITAGSDFHGEVRHGREHGARLLGRTTGGRKIEDGILEAIPPLLKAPKEPDHV
ncbi:MAG: PHP domain-containing protein [Treponema sp.]|jgi:predicted metal-dependent phosphoesterase TrpH|nr:PHP domain-containing protein [Treponema sp.]